MISHQYQHRHIVVSGRHLGFFTLALAVSFLCLFLFQSAKHTNAQVESSVQSQIDAAIGR